MTGHPLPPSIFKSLEAARSYVMKHTGRVLHLLVLHDQTCLHGPNHACTCRPDYVVQDLSAEGLVQGAAAQRDWLDRHRSN